MAAMCAFRRLISSSTAHLSAKSATSVATLLMSATALPRSSVMRAVSFFLYSSTTAGASSATFFTETDMESSFSVMSRRSASPSFSRMTTSPSRAPESAAIRRDLNSSSSASTVSSARMSGFFASASAPMSKGTPTASDSSLAAATYFEARAMSARYSAACASVCRTVM